MRASTFVGLIGVIVVGVAAVLALVGISYGGAECGSVLSPTALQASDWLSQQLLPAVVAGCATARRSRFWWAVAVALGGILIMTGAWFVRWPGQRRAAS